MTFDMTQCKTGDTLVMQNHMAQRWMKIPKSIRPGCGWKALGSGVYEHKSSIRIHVGGGLIRLQDKTFLRLNHFDEGKLGHDLIRINGGNVKRGMMAWASNFATA